MTDQQSIPPARILGLGTARPEVEYTQEEAAAMAVTRCTFDTAQADWLEKRYAHSQVRQRASVFNRGNGQARPDLAHPVVDDFFPPALTSVDRGPTTAQRMGRYMLEAPPLAARAAKAALADAGIDASAITHLVTVSCTGFVAPGIDVLIMEKLGLPINTARTMIGFMGCHGAFNGMRVAEAFAQTDRRARVLLVCVELCSLHFQYGYDPGRIVANALFADGAAAAVIGAGEEASRAGEWSLIDSTSCILPDSIDAMRWEIGDHGFEMTLEPEIVELIKTHLPELLGEWLAGHGLGVEAIGSWAIHPGGPKILSTITAVLGLPHEAASTARQVLSECGNMSSATVLFVIEALRGEGRARGERCVAMGFGPGLTAELALFEIKG